MNRAAARTGLIAVFLAALFPAALSAATLTRGPYLQSGTAEGVTICWRTNLPADSRVRYGRTAKDLDENESSSEETTEHEITLDDLKSGTVYYYSVGSTSETLAAGEEYRFRTFPPPGKAVPTRIWVLGDSGEPNLDAINVRDSYIKYSGLDETDVWLMLGDNAYDSGSDREYQTVVFDRYKEFLRRVVLWPTRGNHDRLVEGANNDYYDIFTLPSDGKTGGLASGSEAYYSFDSSNIHFICLDSEGTDRSKSGPMMQWLKLDLAATKQTWIIAYWHHPTYSKGSHDSDNPKDSGGRMRDMRENALPILEAGGVDLVLSGHSHSYERSMLIDGHYGTSATFDSTMIVDRGDGDPSGNGAYEKSHTISAPHEGAVYTVAGVSSKTSGGLLNHPVMVTSLNVIGSLVIDVNNLELDAVFLDSRSEVRDHFQIRKGATIAAETPPSSEEKISLSSVSPNPLSPHTMIKFDLPEAGHVRLSIVDDRDQPVATLLDERRGKGRHELRWDGRDSSGRPVNPGTYFIQLDAGKQRRTVKIVLNEAGS